MYVNVVGPVRTELLEESKYFVILLGEFIGCSMVRFMHRKNGTDGVVVVTMRKLENRFNPRYETLYFFE